MGADVITTDGRRLRAAPDGDTDLYWALRGAGAGIGAVTSFDIEAVELGDVAIAQLAFAVDADGRALADWASALAASPREITAIATLMGHGGDLVLSVTAVVATDDESAVRDALAPMLAVRPLQATAQLAPYTALVSSAQQHRNVGQQQVTSTTAMLRDVDDATAHALAQVARDPHHPILQFRSLGGAVGDIEPGTTAFAHRAHQFLVVGAVPGRDQAKLAKAWDPLLPHSDGRTWASRRGPTARSSIASTQAPPAPGCATSGAPTTATASSAPCESTTTPTEPTRAGPLRRRVRPWDGIVRVGDLGERREADSCRAYAP
ncbi:hypothetical protein ABZ027_37585 [Streptomyces sp. NPDC006332]|uniref:hypothetical protein n=1 Tax=Streptomyces sp. NPDC006332 TaxID=3155456 RepID=UPI0033BEE2CA